MGNQTSNNQKDLLTTHPYFKHAKIIKQKDHQVLRAFIPSDEETYDQWKTFLDRDIKQLQNSDFVLIPDKHSFHRQSMCANGGKAEIEYQCYPYLLSEEIQRRKEKQQLFIEGDLWFLLYALTGAKNEVEEFCGRVGDIRPENVFISENGQVKVACLYSFPNQRSNFNKFSQSQPTFLAPEDLNLLKQGTTSNDMNKKSELFAIGLTVLSAGLLENGSCIYDTVNGCLNVQKLEILLRKWKESYQYSQIFRAIILNLLQLNGDARLGADEVWRWIVKYEASIKNKEKFLIRTEHEIIEREVARIRANT